MPNIWQTNKHTLNNATKFSACVCNVVCSESITNMCGSVCIYASTTKSSSNLKSTNPKINLRPISDRNFSKHNLNQSPVCCSLSSIINTGWLFFITHNLLCNSCTSIPSFGFGWFFFLTFDAQRFCINSAIIINFQIKIPKFNQQNEQ